jgi:hypothetical protein
MNSMLAGSLEFKPAIKVSPFSPVLKLDFKLSSKDWLPGQAVHADIRG